MKYCKRCGQKNNRNDVSMGKYKFCSSDCCKEYHQNISNSRLSQKRSRDKEKAKQNINEIFKIPKTKVDKSKLISMTEVFGSFRKTPIIHKMKINRIFPSYLKIKKKRADGQVRTYNTVAYSLNDFEKMIFLYHDKYREDLNTTIKDTRNRFLDHWKEIERYLNEQ